MRAQAEGHFHRMGHHQSISLLTPWSEARLHNRQTVSFSMEGAGKLLTLQWLLESPKELTAVPLPLTPIETLEIVWPVPSKNDIFFLIWKLQNHA